MKTYRLECELWLPRSVEEVFAFFCDARNLDVLTPSWLHFQVLTPGPVEMRPGAEIDYRLRFRGVPIRWRSEITVWDPPRRFVDEQRRGPYRKWVHEHRFEERDGGTLAGDRVEYAAPGGSLANRLFVAPDLRRIFRYRQQKLQSIFGEADGAAGPVMIREETPRTASGAADV